MDERRDLVDREELRRRLEFELTQCDKEAAGRGRWAGVTRAMDVLAELPGCAMPAAECPRGWTRDEVLAELDADPDAVCEWLSIHDAEWHPETMQFITGSWHPEVRRYDVRVVRVAPEPEWVPLTQLVGRTIEGETEPVDRIEWVTTAASADCRARWRWHEKDNPYWQPFPEGTLNLETGQVAVRPKGEA